jgi:mRNA interferase MazF
MIGTGSGRMKQYEVYLINLDPTIGHEMKKIRPCVVISPDEMNDNIGTVIIAPMTTKSHTYPSRVGIVFEEKEGWVVLDQMRTIDKKRAVKKLGKIREREIRKIKKVIMEMLVD